jgi:nuclear transport factor 2 (NTF2) superfamily protein
MREPGGTSARRSQSLRAWWPVVPAMLLMVACGNRTGGMNQSQLTDFGYRYAEAWSRRDPALLAAFYSAHGSLTVNDGRPAVGRAEIAATASKFMQAFPDMVVKMDSVSQDGDHAIFNWTWTGTNTGPGGTGRAVRISGYEQWTFDEHGLIRESEGHYDEAEYERQVRPDGEQG